MHSVALLDKDLNVWKSKEERQIMVKVSFFDPFRLISFFLWSNLWTIYLIDLKEKLVQFEGIFGRNFNFFIYLAWISKTILILSKKKEFVKLFKIQSCFTKIKFQINIPVWFWLVFLSSYCFFISLTLMGSLYWFGQRVSKNFKNHKTGAKKE